MAMQVEPPLDFLPSRLVPWLPRVLRPLLPLVLRLQGGIVAVEADHLERLVEAWARFQRGEVRLLLAFRHPQTSDPLAMATLLWTLLPREARARGVRLGGCAHSHFLYDRGVPLWAGRWVGWILSRLGGSSILRSKLDLKGLRAARQLMVDGDFPLAAAPEGATNGFSDVISPLEPGVAQIAFWAVDDLVAAGRDLPVEVVPLGIRYHYVTPIAAASERVLADLERACGLPTPEAGAAPVPQPAIASFDPPPPVADDPEGARLAALYPRLTAVADCLLVRLERFYGQLYRVRFADDGPISAANRGERLRTLLEAALGVSEASFGLTAKGSTCDRCRRIEQAGWDWIYRSEGRDRAHLPAVERGLLDRAATEADRAMWHMRMVESFTAVSGTYVRDHLNADRFGETLQMLVTLVQRLADGASLPPPPRLGLRRARITVGRPIDVGERWPAYREGRQRAVTVLTEDLSAALQQLL